MLRSAYSSFQHFLLIPKSLPVCFHKVESAVVVDYRQSGQFLHGTEYDHNIQAMRK